MNLGELKLFQSAVSMHSAVGADACVGISSQDEHGLSGHECVLAAVEFLFTGGGKIEAQNA